MLKRILILLTLVLVQFGCDAEELYHPLAITEEERQRTEGVRRDFLQLEDLEIGNGAIATWGRKIVADIIVRYSDGTLVYQGPVADYVGFREGPSFNDPSFLPFYQSGIALGLHGMGIGGKRRVVIDPALVCNHMKGGANPIASCRLVDSITVRKEQLTVEATLTESCIPVGTVMSSALGRKTKETGCRRSSFPQRDPSAPIWQVY